MTWGDWILLVFLGFFLRFANIVNDQLNETKAVLEKINEKLTLLLPGSR